MDFIIFTIIFISNYKIIFLWFQKTNLEYCIFSHIFIFTIINFESTIKNRGTYSTTQLLSLLHIGRWINLTIENGSLFKSSHYSTTAVLSLGQDTIRIPVAYEFVLSGFNRYQLLQHLLHKLCVKSIVNEHIIFTIDFTHKLCNISYKSVIYNSFYTKFV
jgi:hypothetical protein